MTIADTCDHRATEKIMENFALMSERACFVMEPAQGPRVGGAMSGFLLPALGILAAALCALSYVPQVKKAWPRGATEDLSLKMLVVLACGLACWVMYGILLGDWIIAIANLISLSLVGSVLGFKIRDLRASEG